MQPYLAKLAARGQTTIVLHLTRLEIIIMVSFPRHSGYGHFVKEVSQATQLESSEVQRAIEAMFTIAIENEKKRRRVVLLADHQPITITHNKKL